MEYKQLRVLTAVCVAVAFGGCSGCNSRQTPQRYEPMNMPPDSVVVDTSSAVMSPEDTEEMVRRNVEKVHNDSYDDGLLDGEAAAEEDRQAGRPGMQVGDEDEDLDYQEGYDDGYDE